MAEYASVDSSFTTSDKDLAEEMMGKRDPINFFQTKSRLIAANDRF